MLCKKCKRKGAIGLTECERIDKLLKERGLSRRKLAQMAGIPPSSLQSAMERNKELSLDMLFPISDVLGVSMYFLHYGFEEEPLSEEDLAYMKKSDEFDIMLSSVMFMLEELNEKGRLIAVERVKELTEIPRYQKKKGE